MRDQQLGDLLATVKRVSREYRALTGRPLGCTGEIAELEAANLLGLELSPVRQAGYDAIRHSPDGDQRIQIKGRCVLAASKTAGRMGRIDITKPWDTVMLVLLDPDLEVTAIYEAPRDVVVEALEAPGSKSRNERGALAISKFKSMSDLVWKR